MSESAVCPHITQRIHEQCPPDWIEIYLRTGGTQIHKDHSTCTKENCFANDLRASNILPRHTSPGCLCPLRGADLDQLQQTLQLHDVALIRLDERDEKIEIRVEPMVSDVQYFAVSHALADGLCNTERNELPECQLRRIIRSVKSAMLTEKLSPDDPVYVWVDIMCLPLRGSPFDGAARGIFRTIENVMANAIAVVVLDSDIAVLSRTSSYAERFLKVSFSSWASRLWTLFEAITAPKLLFECINGVMELEENFLDSSKDITATGDGSDRRPLLYARLGKSRKHHILDLVLLEDALKWGRTSVESDSNLLRTAIRSRFDVPIFELYTFLYVFNNQQQLAAKESGVAGTPDMAEVCGYPWIAL